MNSEHVEVLRDLSEVCRAAIKAGDWKVDGACDPDAALRRADAAIAALSAQQPPAEAQQVAVFNCPNCPVADLSEAARRAADAIYVLLPLLSSEQREVVCDAIAEADEARADILRALAAKQPAPVAPVGVEGRYHPCTHILIDGLKRLEGGTAVLAEWDRARAKADTALSQQPAAVDDLMNAWRAAFIAERAMRYREGGMKIEQARIHAETDAALMEQVARQRQGGES